MAESVWKFVWHFICVAGKTKIYHMSAYVLNCFVPIHMEKEITNFYYVPVDIFQIFLVTALLKQVPHSYKFGGWHKNSAKISYTPFIDWFLRPPNKSPPKLLFYLETLQNWLLFEKGFLKLKWTSGKIALNVSPP